jgi:AcrR family transcriptional regulator
MATKTRANHRRKPLQNRSRDTVEAILEAAAQVFERHGYAAGTTNRIAERAGVSIGSLYQYFPNKDAIVMELSRRHIAQVRAMAWAGLGALAEHVPPLRDGLTAIVRGTVELHKQAPLLQRVLFEETPRSDEVRALLWELFEGCSGLIAAYLEASPEVRVPDVRVAARMVTVVVDEVTHGAIIHPRDGDDPEVFARETITMLERYLTG